MQSKRNGTFPGTTNKHVLLINLAYTNCVNINCGVSWHKGTRLNRAANCVAPHVLLVYTKVALLMKRICGAFTPKLQYG